MSDQTRMEWRVVEATGDPFPPRADPVSRREAAERRLAYYSDPNLTFDGEARLPKLPLRIEWRAVVITEWNVARGLDLVEPMEA